MGVRELFELGGKVALVTGGSRGLGLQIALGLGEMGARVAISARKPQELEAARAQCAARGVEVFPIVHDLSKPDDAPALVEAVVGHCGGLHILINNAGTSWGAPAEEHDLAAWNKVMTLNATSAFALSQAAARRCFIPQHAGVIINVASVAALRVSMNMRAAAYYASKAALLNLTRALAMEWGRHGIRVNAICPGFFPSKLASGLLATIEASVIAATPLGRLGGDTDLQGAVVYLASEASRHVTGQYIAIDGGASAA
jgi:NAD(P)-dependent dehydrogenase (short-subunit alcohol dehydrogenase family)